MSRRAAVPTPSSPAARDRMRAVRTADTAPEVALRSALFRRGLRFRVGARPSDTLRRSADVLFRRARVAVFVDGCFWHGCPEHATWPRANAGFWREKIETNRLRDADTDARLGALGWRVVRVWEHEEADGAAGRIARIVTRRAARRTAAGEGAR